MPTFSSSVFRDLYQLNGLRGPLERTDTPAHWSVTFAVDKADATLGGKVTIPPFDAPWSTSTSTIPVTVIGDPQGAAFIASEFVAKSKDLGSPADAAVGSE